MIAVTTVSRNQDCATEGCNHEARFHDIVRRVGFDFYERCRMVRCKCNVYTVDDAPTKETEK